MKAKGVFIPFNVPSSKNSKTMVVRKEGKPRLINSKATQKYIQASKLGWLRGKETFHKLVEGSPLPLRVGFHFIRKTKHRYDWINMVQICQDLMVEYKWIEDDNTEFLIPIPFQMNGSYSTYDKTNAGVWVVPITEQILTDLKGNINE